MSNEPNNTPLFKELVHLNLAGGVNERDRPETADPTTTLTRVENLIQDQTGAYIKRAGTPVLGATISEPTKLLRLREGLGAIGNSGNFYHYQENLGAWLDKGDMPAFTATADFITSSGPNVTPLILEVASCSAFHAIIVQAGTNSSGGGAAKFLLVYDRDAGVVVARYDIFVQFATTVTPKIAFVGDRYLHLYTIGSGTGLLGVVVDTRVAMPATLTTTALDATGASITDIAVHTDRSIILFTHTATKYVLSMSNAGAALQSQSIAGALQIANSGTKLWYSTATNIGAKDPAALTSDLVATAAHGGAAAGYLAATSANRLYYVSQSTTTTFGTSTTTTLTVATTAANGTSLTTQHVIDGWAVASAPFIHAATGNAYLHVTKASGLTVTPHAVLNITEGFNAINVMTANSYYSTKLACSLEPHIATANSNVLRYFSQDNLHFHPAVPVQTVARGFGYAVFNLKANGHADVATAIFGGANHVSGGCHSTYAGDQLSESGFVDFPLVNTTSSATGITGSFKYIAVYRFMDEAGSVTWSRTSPVSSITVANKQVDVSILPCNVTNRDALLLAAPTPCNEVVELYRTATGGTQYYLCASSQIGTPAAGLGTQVLALGAARQITVADTLADATLITQPALFRQPGTPNSAVDRYPPPCGNPLVQHKDRLFTVDPYGQRVYYSSFFVDGENAWFNPAFSFFVHGASGPITALASMDGRLFVFKRNGIFVVDGDGPPEGGPSGNEYSPPQRLATEFGCVDHRSLAITTEGLVYKSDRGVELLTRSLQVKWLGEKVQNTVDANPKVTGAAIDSAGRYHLGLAASDTDTATQIVTAGVEVVYDFTAGCWTVSHHTDAGGTYDRCFQDICRADLVGLGEVLCYADPYGYVVYEDYTSGLDRGSAYIPWTIETAWVKTGQQNRARFSKALLLAKKLSGANHSITISAAYNYVDSYTQVGTFEPDTINEAALEELTLNLNRPEGIAVRLLFEEGPPTDTSTYPVGTGRGCDVLGIGLEIAQKTGAPKLASGQKV
ncbi:hypothetical protein [Acidithiobacillus sp.]|uniref:hypothetical protein n=1 Tax=Acidithiobacillus sp. TaxID=1872118 RepID=UPI002590CF72|nr:hypothetical protein [Acidithiobacillus sp.]MDD5374475.1 hypothetical protein [Acidithiobacillus sp.]